MKFFCKYAGLFCITLLFILSAGRPASAGNVIVDNASLLSTDELGSLKNTCDQISKYNDISIYIITSKELSSEKECLSYLEKIKNDKNAPDNYIALLISTKTEEPLCYVKCYGTHAKTLTEKRCGRFARQVQRAAANGNPYRAVDGFADNVSEYINRKPELDGVIYRPFLQLILSLLLGCLVLWFLCGWKQLQKETVQNILSNIKNRISFSKQKKNTDFSQMKNTAGEKKEKAAPSFLDAEQSRQMGHLDYFTHSEITK